jgi:hypothetical protein
MILGLARSVLATSAPLGPAWKAWAGPGALAGRACRGFHPGADRACAGAVRSVPGVCPGHAPAIAGPGYLALAARLVEQGVLDSGGHFVQTPATPLPPGWPPGSRLLTAKPVSRRRLPAVGSRTWEELLKVKAACNLALASLLTRPGWTGRSGRRASGRAFGARVAPEDLETLGFPRPGFPDASGGGQFVSGRGRLAADRSRNAVPGPGILSNGPSSCPWPARTALPKPSSPDGGSPMCPNVAEFRVRRLFAP